MIEHVFLLLLGLERNYSTPSAGMQPTIMIGDVYPARSYRLFGHIGPMVFAAPPRPGDIVVFRRITNEDYIKRVVALSGDRVQMKAGRLFINGVMIERRELGSFEDENSYGEAIEVTRYEETLPNGVVHLINEISDDGPLDDTEEYIVPDGHMFVMGDNRDRSADSRVTSQVGFVPLTAAVAMLPPSGPTVYWTRAGQ